MTVYEVPATSPYQRAFRILSWGAIGVLLGILIFSFYEPAGINDSTNRALAWLAGAILLAAIVGTFTLSVKEGSWKLMRMLRFEVSDGRLIEMRQGATSSIIEILLNQIESLGDHRVWLFVIGGTPKKRIFIPKEVRGFEVLKSELIAASGRTPAKVRVKVHPLSLLPLLMMILAYLFFSRPTCMLSLLLLGLVLWHCRLQEFTRYGKYYGKIRLPKWQSPRASWHGYSSLGWFTNARPALLKCRNVSTPS